MRLVAIGRGRADPEAALFERYATRMRPKLELVELPDGHGAPAEIKRREGAAILAALPDAAFVVVLDAAGVAFGSEDLARDLDTWLAHGRPLDFVIGGAEGLAAAVIARADRVLSLGQPTWPHMLARVMLAEQLYRARAIASGHPYHRSGRP